MILGIYGAGGNGKSVLDVINQIQKREKIWDEVIFIDDVVQEKIVYHTKVMTFQDAISDYSNEEINFIISHGEPASRKMLYDKIKAAGYHLATAVHPDTQLPLDCILEEGVILAQAFLGSDIRIGSNTFVSHNAILGHDLEIGSDCIISPASFIAGHCKIGSQVYVGPCAALRDRITVEETAVIAMSAAVFRDVPGDAIAIGNPAKNIKKEKGYRIFG